MTLHIVQRPSPNWNARRDGRQPDMVILHYTGMRSADAALSRLCDQTAEVSCHYLIDTGGKVFALVPEAERAWHAGASSWHGATDINSRSIGIELVNPGHAHGYTDFPAAQMEALLDLLHGIHRRHAIAPGHLLAHSDIAPARKKDPGERFDWAALWHEGFGLWTPALPRSIDLGFGLGHAGPDVGDLQRQLAALGYGLEVTSHFDQLTADTVTAFQRHWRQAHVDGRADRSTRETLAALLTAGASTTTASTPAKRPAS